MPPRQGVRRRVEEAGKGRVGEEGAGEGRGGVGSFELAERQALGQSEGVRKGACACRPVAWSVGKVWEWGRGQPARHGVSTDTVDPDSI